MLKTASRNEGKSRQAKDTLKAALSRQPLVAAVDLGASKVACFVMKPEGVCRADRTLTAAGVGLNLQVSSNVVLAELSWTNAEQTQAIDRVHRIGQTEPVTAWRIIAAQTIDARIAELIDSKAGLAARALDGSDEEVGSSADVQVEALASLLTEALEERGDAEPDADEPLTPLPTGD